MTTYPTLPQHPHRKHLPPLHPTTPTPPRCASMPFQGSLADAWGGSSAHETAQCMLRTANLISGGVELA